METNGSTRMRAWTTGDSRFVITVGFAQGVLLYACAEGGDLSLTAAACVLLVPVTAELLAVHRRRRGLWLFVGVLAAVLVSIGAGLEATVSEKHHASPLATVVFLACSAACAFISTAFVGAGLRQRHGFLRYTLLFDLAWRNGIQLVASVVFTGLFALLLALWAGLFDIVGIRFFAEVFSADWFALVVGPTVFACAVALAQARQDLTISFRQFVHAILGLLLPLAAVVALLFLGTLPFTGLGPLWATGATTPLIAALLGAMILLLNAAYEDGESASPLPRILKMIVAAATVAAPAYVMVSAYSLHLRVAQHGWSEVRVMAAIGLTLLGAYTVGYAIEALRAFPREGELDRINVPLAAAVVMVAVLVNTPVLSPQRISADDQKDRLLSGDVSVEKFDFDYLGSLGTYGRNALVELSESGPGRERIAAAATAELRDPGPAVRGARNDGAFGDTAEQVRVRVEVLPQGNELSPEFAEWLASTKNAYWSLCKHTCRVLRTDLTGDGAPEFTILVPPYPVFQRNGNDWNIPGRLNFGRGAALDPLYDALSDGEFETLPAPVRDLRVNGELVPFVRGR